MSELFRDGSVESAAECRRGPRGRVIERGGVLRKGFELRRVTTAEIAAMHGGHGGNQQTGHDGSGGPEFHPAVILRGDQWRNFPLGHGERNVILRGRSEFLCHNPQEMGGGFTTAISSRRVV